MGFLDERYAAQDELNDWIASHQQAVPTVLSTIIDPDSERRVYGKVQHLDSMGFNRLQMFTSYPQASLASKSLEGLYIAVIFDSLDNRIERQLRREWVGMLRLYNLFQFIPNCFFLTKTQVEENKFQLVPTGDASKIDSTAASIDSAEWQSALDYANPAVLSLLSLSKEQGWEPPEVGEDIEGSDGKIITTAELVWGLKKDTR